MSIPYKTIYVVGPTSSGKSDFAIALAKKCDGEIIGCDSRQIYRHMDIGTGKEPGKLQSRRGRPFVTSGPYISGGVPHYMIDTHHPNTDFNVAKFVKRARRIQEDIWSRGKIPIVCGGTMFWAQSLLEGTELPTIPPNPQFRKSLERHETKALFAKLKTKDSRRYDQLDKNRDHNNRPRIIRALEIAQEIGYVPEAPLPNYSAISEDNLIIAIDQSVDTLKDRIQKRLKKRLDSGMLDEVYNLYHKEKVSWSRLRSFGLEYLWCTDYLLGEISEDVFLAGLERASYAYAKRQRTWLRRWEKKGAQIAYTASTLEMQKIVNKFLS